MDTLERLFTGWFVGDGFGSQTEGMTGEEIAALIEGPLEEVYTLEEHQPLSGMSGVASDFTVLCGLSYLALKEVDTDHLRSKYTTWAKEHEGFSFPQKRDHALALTRTPTFALLAGHYPYTKWEALIRSETAITSSHPLAGDAALLLSRAFTFLVEDEAQGAEHLASLLIREVGKRNLDPKLEVMLRTAVNQKPLAPISDKERVAVIPTLLVAFHTLLSGCVYEEGMDLIAKRGDNSRITCAIYSALKSLIDGDGPPQRWIDEIYPSDTLEAMIKSETLFRRETIKMERLAASLAAGLQK